MKGPVEATQLVTVDPPSKPPPQLPRIIPAGNLSASGSRAEEAVLALPPSDASLIQEAKLVAEAK